MRHGIRTAYAEPVFFFKNWIPSQAIASGVGARSRQIAAAALSASILNPKLLIVQPAVIAKLQQRTEDVLPVHVAAARNTAIVFAGMHVLQMAARAQQCFGNTLFLDVGMNVSHRMPTFGWLISAQSFTASAVVLRK